MKIEVQQPEIIYKRAAETFENMDKYLPPTYLLGEVSPDSGLFSKITVTLGIVYPQPVGYSLVLDASYFDKHYSFWPETYIDRLITSVQVDTKLAHRLHKTAGLMLLDAIDLASSSRFLTVLGWEDEKTGWLDQVKKIDHMLRTEELTNPFTRQRAEEGLEYLVGSPTILPGSDSLQIGLIAPDTDLDRPNTSLLSLAGSTEEFTNKLLKFANYSQNMLNAIVHLRGMEQNDTLILKFDDTDYVALANQGKL